MSAISIRKRLSTHTPLIMDVAYIILLIWSGWKLYGTELDTGLVQKVDEWWHLVVLRVDSVDYVPSAFHQGTNLTWWLCTLAILAVVLYCLSVVVRYRSRPWGLAAAMSIVLGIRILYNALPLGVLNTITSTLLFCLSALVSTLPIALRGAKAR